MYQPKNCIICGKLFIPKIGKQICCNKECAHLRFKEMWKKSHKKWYIPYFAKYPWRKALASAKNRCNRKSYKQRGIKCFLTKEEVKLLWDRDKALLLKKPSLDRKVGNGHYTFENCRFIELKENLRIHNYKCPHCGEIFNLSVLEQGAV